MKKLLIICGPTATGKTKLALTLAKKFDGELVSADSRQVYKWLDILTGKDLPKNIKYQISNIKYKILKQERLLPVYIIEGMPLWLYDVVEPNEPFSVALYQELARVVIDDIVKRGKLPILVGGTGLYIRAVVDPIDTASVPQNLSLRNKLNTLNVSELQKTLGSLDSEKWQQMNISDRQNPRRLIRAIEVVTWNKNHKNTKVRKTPLQDVLLIGLTGPRELLKKNIETRVRSRFVQGVVDEVKQLGKKLNDQAIPAATSLGLAVVRRYVDGEIEVEEAINLWTAREYNYAKRQMTWFKKQMNTHWFGAGDKQLLDKVEALVAPWYTHGV